MKKQRWHKRFESFGLALERLEESLNKTPLSELEKDGVIQRFEFTFELAWKTLQDFFVAQGYNDIKGPQKCLSQAFEDGYIEDDEIWMSILSDRNLMTHTYNKSASEEVFDKIQGKYFQALCDLFHVLKKEQK